MPANHLGQLGDYEIKQLKVFKTVVECKGFSAAETELNISRPTISNHIANLESRLGMKLCQRGRGGFALTEEGHVIYEQVQELLTHLERFRNTVNNLSNDPTGQLKVAFSDMISLDERTKMPDIFATFNQSAPSVELIVEVKHMKTMEMMVLNNQLDIAIIPYHRELEGLDYIHLYTDINYLYCSDRHPFFTQSEQQLSKARINSQKIVHAGLMPHEEVYQQIAQMNLASVSYYYETRIAMLLSGCYLAFLPQALAQPYIDAGRLKAIATQEKNFRLGVAVISKKSAQPNRARNLFLEAIRKVHNTDNKIAPY
ncbi:MAG: LysR family transcriptional regulator [Pontibacterium sp.]